MNENTDPSGFLTHLFIYFKTFWFMIKFENLSIAIAILEVLCYTPDFARMGMLRSETVEDLNKTESQSVVVVLYTFRVIISLTNIFICYMFCGRFRENCWIVAKVQNLRHNNNNRNNNNNKCSLRIHIPMQRLQPSITTPSAGISTETTTPGISTETTSSGIATKTPSPRIATGTASPGTAKVMALPEIAETSF